MSRAVQSMIITAAVVGGLLVLRFLVPWRAADPCAAAPSPAACRALSGAPAADLAPPDIAAPPPVDAALGLLLAGQDALRHGWTATASRLCLEAAQSATDRVPGLLCAGGAALRLGWPARAVFLGQRALAAAPLPSEEGAAWVLIGEGHRLQKECKAARTAYLRALDAAPDLEAARRGLEACAAAAPPEGADLTETEDGEGDEGEEGSADA